jgi:Protein of unknown function (DUF2652)
VTSQEAPSAASGQLLLADISGYTSFLQSVALAHKDDAFADGVVPPAYAVLSNLLDGIVGRVIPPFRLSELEGDAVFAYATNSDPVPRGAAMLDCLTECYADFRRRVGAALDIWPCGCDACTRIYVLDLKFILHDGAYVTQEIAGKRKLVGPEVVMAHRLLKNNAAELVGHSAYALITAAAAATRPSAPTSFHCGRPEAWAAGRRGVIDARSRFVALPMTDEVRVPKADSEPGVRAAMRRARHAPND